MELAALETLVEAHANGEPLPEEPVLEIAAAIAAWAQTGEPVSNTLGLVNGAREDFFRMRRNRHLREALILLDGDLAELAETIDVWSESDYPVDSQLEAHLALALAEQPPGADWELPRSPLGLRKTLSRL